MKLAAATLLLVATPALAGTVPVKGATASSYYTEEGNYGPERIMDGKQGTSWVEGDAGSGLGAWVELDLGETSPVDGIMLWGGDWYSHDSWTRANRPKDVELKFSDDSTEIITLADEKKPQTFAFKERSTSTIRIRLKSTYSGTTWTDTGISEVKVLSSKVGTSTPKAAASSFAAEDGDGTYVATNALDGLADSMWCEGNKESDGTGEWISFDFGETRTISKARLINGMGSSLSLWMKANRATTATLAFSDGSTTDVELKGSMRPQEISFPSVATSSVKITFTGVTKGKEFNDLCLSEIQFSK